MNLHQLRSEAGFNLLAFRRNPAATFFTVGLPIIFLVVFSLLFGNEEIESRDGLRAATFYVPGILALAIISATMVNQAITTVTKRESGLLKRVLGTPLPASVFVIAQILASVVLTALMTVLVIGIGGVFFGVSLQWSRVWILALTVILAVGAFCALGLALTSVIPSVDAAPAITNAIVLPLYFISDVFVVTDGAPRFVTVIADIFPIKHLGAALFVAFDPADSASIPWTDWAVLVAWGLLGVVVAARRFRWTPWGT